MDSLYAGLHRWDLPTVGLCILAQRPLTASPIVSAVIITKIVIKNNDIIMKNAII
jgi:hypothetical protein